MDLAHCFRAKDGTIYCWDRDKNSWVKFRTTDVGYDQLPSEIIEQLSKYLAKLPSDPVIQQ
jgi:hypothetical protein